MSVAASRVPSDEDLQAEPADTTVLAYDQAIAHLEDAVHAVTAHDVEARKAAVRAAIEAVTSLYLELTTRQRLEGKDRLAELYGYVIGRVLRINLFNDARFASQATEFLDLLYESLRTPRSCGQVDPSPDPIQHLPAKSGHRDLMRVVAEKR